MTELAEGSILLFLAHVRMLQPGTGYSLASKGSEIPKIQTIQAITVFSIKLPIQNLALERFREDYETNNIFAWQLI